MQDTQHASERQPRRDLTFRVFVSSTFSDLKAERNALQQDTYPKLREYCRERGARFQAIDLRWGVSQEAALDQQTMRICMAELARCQELSPKPNFIVLLGQRYGWRPLPETISAEVFEVIRRRLTTERTETRRGMECIVFRSGDEPLRESSGRSDAWMIPATFFMQFLAPASSPCLRVLRGKSYLQRFHP